MACPINKEELKKLEAFVGFCSMQPQILNMPDLLFFKTFIEKMGGKVPEGEFKFPRWVNSFKLFDTD